MASESSDVNQVLAAACPCEGCLFVERCRDQQLACGAFAAYLQGVPERIWQRVHREPSSATYSRLGLT